MGGFYDDFSLELATLRKRYESRPERELLRLYLVALEREELVTVAYRDDLIHRRLESLPLDGEARAVIRQALVWTWKDEEMHAVYIRGELLRHRSALVRARALYHNVTGLMAGWATFVQQHVRWSQAPVSRALSSALLWIGLLTGTAPPSVRKHLRYHSFRDFCEFNVDAERTASLCWERLVELGTAMGLPASLVESFRRVKLDEDHHRALFEILTESLGEGDRLLPEVTAETLVGRIGALGEGYLPRRFRADLVAESPLGQGGPVVVAEGRGSDDKLAVLADALDAAKLGAHLEAAATRASKDLSALRVVIKPTFMLGYHRADLSTVTDPELLHALVRVLREAGISDVTIVEAPNVYDRFFDGRGVEQVARYFGIGSPELAVADASTDQVPVSYDRGLSQQHVSRAWKEADFRIVFGKLRSHPVEIVHLCLGALEGLGDRSDAFLFADRTADRDVATLTLIDRFPPHFALLDAHDAAPDGLAGMMGCRRPKRPRRVYAGADAIAVDVVAARHVGMADPRGSKLVATACHWFGDPSASLEIAGVDTKIEGWRAPYRGEWSALASLFAYAVYVIASDRGAFFVPAMDTRAFPPRAAVGFWLRIVRWAVRVALGLPRRMGSSTPKAPA